MNENVSFSMNEEMRRLCSRQHNTFFIKQRNAVSGRREERMNDGSHRERKGR